MIAAAITPRSLPGAQRFLHTRPMLPDALKSIRTQPLFVMRLEVKPPAIIGTTPGGFRRVGIVPGGTFEGERLSGTVIEGADWQMVRSDAITLDVRLVLKTDRDELLTMAYRGFRHGPPEVLERSERGEQVDPTSYYFRIAPLFETAAPRLAWLNHTVCVGTGHRTAEGPTYSVFEVL